MPCDTRPNLDQQQKDEQRRALDRLEAAIGAGAVRVVVGRNGAVALNGWKDDSRGGLSDLCAFRKLANTPTMRRAIAAAEARAGVKLDRRVLAAGVHSHDGGDTWHGGH